VCTCDLTRTADMLYFLHNCGAFLGRNEALLIGAARMAIEIAKGSSPVLIKLNVRALMRAAVTHVSL
jgi:hypothetical protein